jgi:mannosyltransferase OCH1-like enzyme
MIESTDEISENNIEFNSLEEGYKIPNIVHYTFCTETNIPNEIKIVIQHNKKMCSNCKFIFYDDNACDEFIKENFDEKVYNAYNSINPVYGAMKADFFRYCVLYKTGGIYIDIKSIIKYPIFKIIDKTDICILDYPRTAYERWRKYTLPTFEQWLLIFAPGHPYLLSMINLMVHYTKIHYQPTIKYIPYLTTKEKILNITGPDAFAKAISIYVNGIKTTSNVLHRNIDYKKYFKINHNENYKQMYKMNNRTHYSDLNLPFYKNQVKYENKYDAYTYGNVKSPRKNLNLMK